MISVYNPDCAGGRSPCHKCEKHKKGIPRTICSVNCQKLFKYRGIPEPVPIRKDEKKPYTRKIPFIKKECCVEGCHIDSRTWELCEKHSGRWKHGASLVHHPITGRIYADRNKKNVIKIKQKCCVGGCDCNARAHGLCIKHYGNWKRGFSLVLHPLTGKKYAERNDLSEHELCNMFKSAIFQTGKSGTPTTIKGLLDRRKRLRDHELEPIIDQLLESGEIIVDDSNKITKFYLTEKGRKGVK